MCIKLIAYHVDKIYRRNVCYSIHTCHITNKHINVTLFCKNRKHNIVSNKYFWNVFVSISIYRVLHINTNAIFFIIGVCRWTARLYLRVVHEVRTPSSSKFFQLRNRDVFWKKKFDVDYYLFDPLPRKKKINSWYTAPWRSVTETPLLPPQIYHIL